MARSRSAIISALAALSFLFAPMSARPCSRIVWNDNGKAVVVGRSMDWLNPMPTDLYLLPRGIKRDGMTGKNTLTWTAKYGSVTAVPTRSGASGSADGVNEKGLAGRTKNPLIQSVENKQSRDQKNILCHCKA